MKRSGDRLRVSHAGSLPRPEKLQSLIMDGKNSKEIVSALDDAVRTVVDQQIGIGIDTVTDGELGKFAGFSGYVADRLGGIETRRLRPGETTRSPNRRDRREFPGFYAAGLGAARRQVRGGATATLTTSLSNATSSCTGPIKYIGSDAIRKDITRLKEAAKDIQSETFMAAVAPGTIEHWLWNEYYPDDESFLLAIADAMREEYRAIADAGLILQIDNPDLPDGWQVWPDMDLKTYRRHAEIRVEALNHALTGIPEEQVRLHVCWGSQHGPHKNDIPLNDIVDLVLKVPAQCYSVEGANPVHEHEWEVWKNRLPSGKLLMPGVVSHCTDLVERPEVVAQRLLRYAAQVGRENVIAGTDCGLGSRVGHAEICWAKLEALVLGARIASQTLW